MHVMFLINKQVVNAIPEHYIVVMFSKMTGPTVVAILLKEPAIIIALILIFKRVRESIQPFTPIQLIKPHVDLIRRLPVN